MFYFYIMSFDPVVNSTGSESSVVLSFIKGKSVVWFHTLGRVDCEMAWLLEFSVHLRTRSRSTTLAGDLSPPQSHTKVVGPFLGPSPLGLWNVWFCLHRASQVLTENWRLDGNGEEIAERSHVFSVTEAQHELWDKAEVDSVPGPTIHSLGGLTHCLFPTFKTSLK